MHQDLGPLGVETGRAKFKNSIDWMAHINNKHLFLIVLKTGKFKIKAPGGSVSGESSLSGS